MDPLQTGPADATGQPDAADQAPRPGGEDRAYLHEREQTENFPVALRLLPRRVRTHLAAVYDVARVIDDLGDAAEGDRRALLLDYRADLATIWAGGRPRAASLVRLAPTVAACHLSEQPFQDLVEANLVDQDRTRYPTYADLAAYCALSANPVGRIVLEIFGVSTPERVALSDDVCTALQIVEHTQDVREDHGAGRIYMPEVDRKEYAVDEAAFDHAPADPALRRLLAFEIDRAENLLDAGVPLVASLHGWARIAIAGYVAGGRATIDALRGADFDVMSQAVHGRKKDVVRHAVALLRGRGEKR